MGTGRWLALHMMAEQGKVVGGQLYLRSQAGREEAGFPWTE